MLMIIIFNVIFNFKNLLKYSFIFIILTTNEFSQFGINIRETFQKLFLYELI
jgi:hypothetical protein